MINNWYRDMNPPPEHKMVRVRETSPGVWEPDEHGTHEIWASMLPLHAAPDPDGPHEIPGMPPCICSRCVTRRAGEKTAAGAIEQARQDAKAIGLQAEMAQFLRDAIESGVLDRRDPLILSQGAHVEITPDGSRPVYGVTGPAVSAGGPGIFGAVAVRTPAPPPEPEDEAAAMWRSFWEPAFLSPEELDRLAPFAPPGSCAACHLPAVPGKPMCWYCAALHEITVRAAQAPHPVASAVETELARRALSCTHGASWVRDGRCARCGKYAKGTPPGTVPDARPARRGSPVVLLVLGMAIVYIVVLAGLPHLLGVLGALLIIRALGRAVRK